MRCILLTLAALLVISAPALAQTKAREPHPVTATFYVSHVECAQCIDAIVENVKKVKSVTAVEGLTPDSGYALVSFDTHASSYHQVAKAIGDTIPVHGQKYEPTLKIQVPEYAQGDNAAKIDAIFKRVADRITVQTVNRDKGEFIVRFLPLTLDTQKEGPQGFNAGLLGHPIHDPPPKGLGLTFSIVRAKK